MQTAKTAHPNLDITRPFMDDTGRLLFVERRERRNRNGDQT